MSTTVCPEREQACAGPDVDDSLSRARLSQIDDSVAELHESRAF
jgi:hypothetical protein